MPVHRLLIAALALAAACSNEGRSGNEKPAGTHADPVEVCERPADICRYKGAQLGVCTIPSAETRPAECADRSPCLICTPQH